MTKKYMITKLLGGLLYMHAIAKVYKIDKLSFYS